MLAEDRRPPDGLWAQPLVASRLLEYELWTRLNARRLGPRTAKRRAGWSSGWRSSRCWPNVLARALEPFPVPVRTLDALHLASIEFLRERGQEIELASYDDRLVAAARSVGIPIARL